MADEHPDWQNPSEDDASEMLECRRLANLQQLIEEYIQVVDVKLTTSEKNLIDRLTRVPQR